MERILNNLTSVVKFISEISSKRIESENPSPKISKNKIPKAQTDIEVVIVSSDEETPQIISNFMILEYCEVRISNFRDRTDGKLKISPDSLQFTVNCFSGVMRIVLSSEDVEELSCSEANLALFVTVTPTFLSKVETVINTNCTKPVNLTQNECFVTFIWPRALSVSQHRFIHRTGQMISSVSEFPSSQALVLLRRNRFLEFINDSLIALVTDTTTQSLRVSDSSKFVYPNSAMPGSITVTSSDINCLDKDEFLNDVIINFYLKYLINEKVSPRVRQQVHIFNTFFFESLNTACRSDTREEMVARHAKVKSWTKDVDIFSKSMIFVPININYHWLFAMIWRPSLIFSAMDESQSHFSKFPSIIVVDSLAVSKYPSIVRTLREYLEVELTVRRPQEERIVLDRTNVKGFHPKVPQQENSSDCGLHMLEYIERILFSPLVDFSTPSPDIFKLLRQECPCMDDKRTEIASICYRLLNI